MVIGGGGAGSRGHVTRFFFPHISVLPCADFFLGRGVGIVFFIFQFFYFSVFLFQFFLFLFLFLFFFFFPPPPVLSLEWVEGRYILYIYIIISYILYLPSTYLAKGLGRLYNTIPAEFYYFIFIYDTVLYCI